MRRRQPPCGTVSIAHNDVAAKHDAAIMLYSSPMHCLSFEQLLQWATPFAAEHSFEWSLAVAVSAVRKVLAAWTHDQVFLACISAAVLDMKPATIQQMSRCRLCLPLCSGT